MRGLGVSRARRQYDPADPENRLVAAELESRWNAALFQVADLEGRLAEHGIGAVLPDLSERELLLKLGYHLQAQWDQETGTLIRERRGFMLPRARGISLLPWAP